MTKRLKKIQSDSIKKYDSIISWLEKQPKRSRNFDILDINSIGISLGHSSCSYCLEFICDDCPANPKKSEFLGDPEKVCCEGLWYKMRYAKTPATAIKYAKLIKQYIIDNG